MNDEPREFQAGESAPDETGTQAFARRMAEQAEAERKQEQAERAAAFQNPSAQSADDTDAGGDMLRALAREQSAHRRRVKRRMPR